MGYDETKAEAKRQELRTLMAGAFGPAGGDEADRLAAEAVDHFASVTAPEAGALLATRTTLREGGLGGGTSTKPGNVVLNLRKLIVAIASGGLTIAGALAAPWTVVLGALVVWDALWSCLQLEISDVQACVLCGLWTSRDERGTVPKQEVPEIVNRERAKFSRQPLADEEIDFAVRDLTKMRCIGESVGDPTRWWLREWVRIKYD